MRILFLLFIPFCLAVNDVETLCLVNVLLFVARGWDYYKKHNIVSYMDIWNLAFTYIVLSEIVLSSNKLQLYGFESVRFILISNVLINIGFLFNIRVKKKIEKMDLPQVRTRGALFFNILIFFALIFFAHKIDSALLAFQKGRGVVMRDAVGGGNLLNTFQNQIGSIIPIISAYFFRYYFNYKYKIRFFIIIVLCILPQILWGTRYILLFSFVAPLIILFDNRKLKTGILLFSVFAFSMVVVSLRLIRENRYVEEQSYNYDSLSQKVASYGSNEEIVSGTIKIFEYFRLYDYSYGRESAFSLYFWVPRTFWPEKPTQLSYWFVRTYNPYVGESFSAAYGYWGELLMDFGYLSLLLYLPFGLLLKRLEITKNMHIQANSYNAVFYYALLPFFFFSVRSPQTAIIALVLIYLIYRIIGYIISKLKYKFK